MNRMISVILKRIQAMRYNKVIVFAGAYSALVIMTGLSCALGQVVGLIPQYITHYIAASLFAIFALQMIYEGTNFDMQKGLFWGGSMKTHPKENLFDLLVNNFYLFDAI